MVSLQRTLLSDNLVTPDHREWTEWTNIFTEVLFPLITELLKPEVHQQDPMGMSETRLRAATLLSKVFLHYLAILWEEEKFLDLWLKIITVMDRLINSGQGDNLVGFLSQSRGRVCRANASQEEAVAENVKNMLLVMSTSGYLVPPDEKPELEKVWTDTWKRVNRFLPNFQAELFPPSKKEEAKEKTEDDNPEA
jgi:brefeldin A-resistance guanine nucleotide exchange factor 1